MKLTLIDGYEAFHSLIILIGITKSDEIFNDNDENEKKTETDVSSLRQLSFDDLSSIEMIIVNVQPSQSSRVESRDMRLHRYAENDDDVHTLRLC